MARTLRMWSFLIGAAVGVAPPAMMPPPVRPAAVTSGAVVSQTPGTSDVTFATSSAISASNPTPATRPSGQSSRLETLQSKPTTETEALSGYQQVLQPPYAPRASITEWASSLGALFLVVFAGAVAGAAAVAWRQPEAMKNKDSATEMTASSSMLRSDVECPKFAVAAFAGEEPFDPAGLKKDGAMPRSVGGEIVHGRMALMNAATLVQPEDVALRHAAAATAASAASFMKPEDLALRRAAATAAAAAAATMPVTAWAADPYPDYNMAGEWTNFFIVGYFALTIGYTGVAFASYLILTKLKII